MQDYFVKDYFVIILYHVERLLFKIALLFIFIKRNIFNIKVYKIININCKWYCEKIGDSIKYEILRKYLLLICVFT